jgi:hypothetical protein
MVTTDEWCLTRNPGLRLQLPEDDPVLPQMITTEDVTREEDIQMLDTIPISLEYSMNLPPQNLLQANSLAYNLQSIDFQTAFVKEKEKRRKKDVILVPGLGGLYDCQMLRIPVSKYNWLKDGGEVSLMHWPCSTPLELIFLCLS